MYQFTNNAKTTLASGLASGGTSISVTTGSVFPTEGNFRVTIWSSSYGSPGLDANAEIIEVSSRSSNTLTILDDGRGLESTSDLVHTSGSNIALTLTAEVLERIETQPHYVIAKDGTGDYNCTGTDHTGDDQTVINSAIDEITSGSVVVFKPDTYYLKGKGKDGADNRDWGAIHIEKELHVMAYGATFDNKQGPTGAVDEDDEYTVCFQWYSDNACDNSTWFGGKFVYTDRIGTPTAGGGAIWIRPKDASGNLYKGSNIRVKDINVEVDSSVVFGALGIYNQRCNDVKIDSCTFKNTNSSAITYDGEATDADNILDMNISNCEFDECDRGIRHNDEDVFFRSINVSNCNFKDCYAPIFIGVAKNVNLSNINIENATDVYAVSLGIASTADNTLESVNVSNLTINKVTAVGGDGLVINNVADKINLSNIVITNVTQYAVRLQRLKTKNVNINNITIDQSDTTAGWGIFSYSDTGVDKDVLQISNAIIYPKSSGLKIDGYEDVQLSNIVIDGTSSNDSDEYGVQMMSSVTDANLSNVKVKNWDDSGTGADFIFQNSGSVNQSNVNDKNGNTKTTKTLAASATTFEVTSDFMVITGDSGANTIGTITGGIEGQELRLLFVDNKVTITDTDAHTADTIDLSASFTSADDTVLKLLYDGTSWYEVSRSVN